MLACIEIQQTGSLARSSQNELLTLPYTRSYEKTQSYRRCGADHSFN